MYQLFLLLILQLRISLFFASTCKPKNADYEITCCSIYNFDVDISNVIDYSSPCDVTAAANNFFNLQTISQQDLEDCIDDYNYKNAAKEFIEDKIFVLLDNSNGGNISNATSYNFLHDISFNVNNETVFKRSDNAYYLFYGITADVDTYGWYLHNDNSKLNQNPFTPTANNTLFYQHDSNRYYQLNNQACPHDTTNSLEWEVEYSQSINKDLTLAAESIVIKSQYHKLQELLNITMQIKCQNLAQTQTVQIKDTASYATNCNAYGIDLTLVESIEDNYEAIFNNFDISLPPLSDTPFWIGLGWHVLSCIFLIGMGIYPIFKMPASSLDKSQDKI